MRKRVILSTLLMATLASAAALASDRSGFDGKWVLDKHASNTGTEPVPDGLQQTIKTKGSDVVVQSVFKEPANAVAPLLYLGIMTSEIKMGTDGNQTVNQVGPFMQTCKTTIDGNKMDTDWVAKHTSGEVVNGHWTRTLSDDGKHMTLQIQESSTQGQSGNATLNFVRK